MSEDKDAVRPCSSCGTELSPGQEWCLSCGKASNARIGRSVGARAAATSVGITLLLAGGAVAASTAALTKDPVRKGDIAYPLQVTTQAAAPAPPATTTTKTPAAEPEVQEPEAPKSFASASLPAPTPDIGSTDTPAADPPADSGAKADAAAAKPEPIKIAEGAGSLYDPLARNVVDADDPQDPAAVYDGDDESSWSATSNGDGPLQVGYVIDLKKEKSLKYLTLLTDTPGFTAEIYGATADVLPPQITDAGWTKLKARDNVDGTDKEDGVAGDGKEKITFSDGADKYRFVLIWATTPAADTPPDPPSRTVRLFDLKLYS
ncbi:MAG TPA: hypothetical protein VNT22_06925 [Baekduia sp.]|nr:hypothetical protein [Baekduia sp.]